MTSSVSLRTANVGLVVLCALVVGTVTTALAVWSGDRAVQDTEDSRDDSVDAAFSFAEETVLELTDQFLGQVGTGVVISLAQFFGSITSVVQTMCDAMSTADDATVQSWDHIYAQRVYLVSLMKAYPVDGLGIVTMKDQAVIVSESTRTTARSPTEYHHYMQVLNDGSNVNLSYMGDIMPGTADMYGWPGNMSNIGTIGCVGNVAIATNGAEFEAPCRYPTANLAKRQMPLFGQVPPKTVYVLPMQNTGPFVGVTPSCDYATLSGQRYGTVFTGLDLRRVTLFLTSMDLGNDRGSLGRIFLVVRDNWVAPGYQVGHLAGTSHGSPFYVSDDKTNDGIFSARSTQLAANCSDNLVAGAGRYLHQPATVNGVETLKYEEVLQGNETHAFELNTDRRPEGEGFYLSVKSFQDGIYINWYVVTMVDRYFVLNAVDEKNRATRASVAVREEEVHSDLRDARTLMYIVVILCVLAPIALTVVLVFRITKPLMLLMQDMSHVAVMNLEAVDADRPPSMLSEVRGMEISFKQMLKNLVGYRQYLPQSVLVDSETEGPSASSSHDRRGSSGMGVGGVAPSDTHSSSSATKALPVRQLFDSSLRSKSITLLCSNIRSLHTSMDATPLGTIISSYLEPLVQCARQQRGVVDDVCGDRVIVSFNTAIPAVSHNVNAVELTSVLRQQWKDTVQVNMAVASGKAVCGNMGCTGMKKYGVVGNVASNVRMLERCGNAWKVPVICDNTVAAEVTHFFTLRKVVMVKLKRGNTTMLHDVVGNKSCGTDEWMYQLEESRNSDPYRLLNNAVVSVYEGDPLVAKQHLEGCTVPGAEVAHELVAFALRTGVAPEPVDIFAMPSTSPMG